MQASSTDGAPPAGCCRAVAVNICFTAPLQGFAATVPVVAHTVHNICGIVLLPFPPVCTAFCVQFWYACHTHIASLWGQGWRSHMLSEVYCAHVCCTHNTKCLHATRQLLLLASTAHGGGQQTTGGMLRQPALSCCPKQYCRVPCRSFGTQGCTVLLYCMCCARRCFLKLVVHGGPVTPRVWQATQDGWCLPSQTQGSSLP